MTLPPDIKTRRQKSHRMQSKEVEKRAATNIGENFSTISFDGWSNARNKQLTGAAFCTNGKTYLADVKDTTGFPLRAENLYERCGPQIENAKKGTGLVTENSAGSMATFTTIFLIFSMFAALSVTRHGQNWRKLW